MALRRDIDPEKVRWYQWPSRSQHRLIAYAEDPDAVERTGVRRALNGAAIPEYAKPAQQGTKRDPTCVKLLRRLATGKLHKGLLARKARLARERRRRKKEALT